MTKFMTLPKLIVAKDKAKKTLFTKVIEAIAMPTPAGNQPSNFKNVLFLGNGNYYGDVFKAWNDDEANFILYLGKKGDEFKDQTMETIIIIALILATLLMIAIHHFSNWLFRKAWEEESVLTALIGLVYILLNVLYIAFLYRLFTELNKL